MLKGIVDLAIDLVEEHSRIVGKRYIDVHNSVYVEQLRTIHIDLGRRTGKTSYINAKAKEGDLIICHRSTCEELYKTSATVVSATSLRYKDEFDLSPYNYIFIDEPALCTQVLANVNWFREFEVNRYSLVIKLGK